MEPKFKCPYCGAERYHRLTLRSVTVIGEFYFKNMLEFLDLNHTFCDIECLLAYIAEWKEQHAD